ncbi:MAG: hypothetical protein CMA12_08905 [Euryarchaeota archaeon]|nr:hypothetical protein [Euryarchaeota archaeon]
MKKKDYPLYKKIEYLDICINKLKTILKALYYLLFSISFLSAQADLFMSGGNRPFADAGRDINTISKGSIFLDGSRSYVSDGSKIKYHWTFSPGLVLNSDNDFSSEISIETYGEQYLRTVETYKEVLDVQLAPNEPGTKLEVILKIKDRIGFEDFDTLIVEYYDPTIATADTTIDISALDMDSINISVSDSDSVVIAMKGSNILIQGIQNQQIDIVDQEIINSIIADHLKDIGYRPQVFLNKNLKKEELNLEFNFNCNTDSCASKNAQIVNAGYVISWGFSESDDMFLIKVFNSEQYKESIASENIPNPYETFANTGIYGIELQLRDAISKMMSSRVFKKEISTINRLSIKNERLLTIGKYPFIIGGVYLLIDKILSRDDDDPAPKQPPGFPHDGI